MMVDHKFYRIKDFPTLLLIKISIRVYQYLATATNIQQCKGSVTRSDLSAPFVCRSDYWSKSRLNFILVILIGKEDEVNKSHRAYIVKAVQRLPDLCVLLTSVLISFQIGCEKSLALPKISILFRLVKCKWP